MIGTYSDHQPKFSSPMAKYVYRKLMLNGIYGSLSADEGVGNGWAEVYGKRILSGDTQGFVYLTKFASAAEAEEVFNEEWSHDE